ncbi:hypothetical protein N0V94_004613 [Neodidymelliopsis sp. IMI 364377]|nr:hypothetical protein N0V94_004613 [Neodidymelliopsis sp. IMI 364377]
MAPKRRATQPTTADIDDQDANPLPHLVTVTCYHEGIAAQKRDKFMKIVKDAGCDVIFVYETMCYFAFITPAGLDNPLLFHADDDTYMQEVLLEENVKEATKKPEHQESGQKGADGAAECA